MGTKKRSKKTKSWKKSIKATNQENPSKEETPVESESGYPSTPNGPIPTAEELFRREAMEKFERQYKKSHERLNRKKVRRTFKTGLGSRLFDQVQSTNLTEKWKNLSPGRKKRYIDEAELLRREYIENSTTKKKATKKKKSKKNKIKTARSTPNPTARHAKAPPGPKKTEPLSRTTVTPAACTETPPAKGRNKPSHRKPAALSAKRPVTRQFPPSPKSIKQRKTTPKQNPLTIVQAPPSAKMASPPKPIARSNKTSFISGQAPPSAKMTSPPEPVAPSNEKSSTIGKAPPTRVAASPEPVPPSQKNSSTSVQGSLSARVACPHEPAALSDERSSTSGHGQQALLAPKRRSHLNRWFSRSNPGSPVNRAQRPSSPGSSLGRGQRPSCQENHLSRWQRMSSPESPLCRGQRMSSRWQRMSSRESPLSRAQRMTIPVSPVSRAQRPSSPRSPLSRWQRPSCRESPLGRWQRMSNPGSPLSRAPRPSSPGSSLSRWQRLSSQGSPLSRTQRPSSPASSLSRWHSPSPGCLSTRGQSPASQISLSACSDQRFRRTRQTTSRLPRDSTRYTSILQYLPRSRTPMGKAMIDECTPSPSPDLWNYCQANSCTSSATRSRVRTPEPASCSPSPHPSTPPYMTGRPGTTLPDQEVNWSPWSLALRDQHIFEAARRKSPSGPSSKWLRDPDHSHFTPCDESLTIFSRDFYNPLETMMTDAINPF